jgi:hypothetical protein
MSSLRKFPGHLLKIKPKLDQPHVTSVNILEKHRAFLEENGLSLSAVTREAIDNMMKAKGRK